jgi:hypothetical protein
MVQTDYGIVLTDSRSKFEEDFIAVGDNNAAGCSSKAWS